MKPRAAITANRGFALTNSRLQLIRWLRDEGWQVVVFTADDRQAGVLAREGCDVRTVVFDRGGLALLRDVKAFGALWQGYRRTQPRLIHHFHAKPVILGTIAARLALGRRVKIVNTITGLGHAFITGGPVRTLAAWGYRIALGLGDRTIFQNADDESLFVRSGWVARARTHLIVSAGVDSRLYDLPTHVACPGSEPTVLMVGRLLWQKGVGEYVEAARLLREKWPRVRFLLAGEVDDVHPDAVPLSWVREQEGRGVVTYLGYVDDMPALLATIDLFVLPSYREGVPRVVLEAAASGVPTVAADVPGTREVVADGRTGCLVPVRDAEALARRIDELLGDPEKRRALGLAARELARERFDIRVVSEKQLAVYRDLLDMKVERS